jgi:putative ABC transport system permease protein
LSTNRPDAVLADGVFQSLAVRGSTTDQDLATTIDALEIGVDAFTIDEAVEAIPGVSEQRGTFNQILGVTVVIALVVIALFFALITVERTSLYGVLKAIGARSSTIFVGLVTQAVVLTLSASAIAGLLVIGLDAAIPPGSIPLFVSPSRLITSVVLLLVAAAIGSAFSLRRILRVDPASALGSSS